MWVTYSLCTIDEFFKVKKTYNLYTNAPLLCFQNALAYFVKAISYAHNLVIKSWPGANFIELFAAVVYKFS